MAIALRCGGRMYGSFDAATGRLEVKCTRRGCGVKPGVVVLHYFDVSTGRLVETKRFQDANRSDLITQNKEKIA